MYMNMMASVLMKFNHQIFTEYYVVCEWMHLGNLEYVTLLNIAGPKRVYARQLS